MQAGTWEFVAMLGIALIGLLIPLTTFILSLLLFLRVRRIEMMVMPRDDA